MTHTRTIETCDLCGLTLRFGIRELPGGERPLRFCCQGCRMVYSMLAEAADSPDPRHFRETDLFRELQAAGVIPASEADLARRRPTEVEVDDSPRQSTEGLPLEMRVAGMWCPACAWVIARTLERQAGIYTAVCNFSTDRVHCRYDPVATGPEKIAAAVRRLGYRTLARDEREEARAGRREFVRLVVAALLTVNVMMLSFALYAGFFTTLTPTAVRNISWPIFLMAAVVLFYGGRPIFRKAWSGLRAAAPGMEVLIAAGSAAAFGYSLFNLLRGSIHLYFDTASMLITLVLLGKTLERRARDVVQADLGAFLNLRPAKVRICSDAEPAGRYTAAESLALGDVFRVTAGEIAAGDGRIVEGRASVDEAAVTGEPRPVNCGPGDRLRSGGRVIEGDLRVRATAVGERSTLGGMIAIMERALDRRSPIEGRTDRLLLWFTPAVVALAAATGLACVLLGTDPGQAVIRSVTVLVISCPCALGIAIPLARVAGISLAARRGVLLRDFSAFERVRDLDAFVLDKTGTVTVGQWTLRSVRTDDPPSERRALALAAALETESEHPVGSEIRRQARRRGISPAALKDIRPAARGIEGRRGRSVVRIGAADFVPPTNFTEPGTYGALPDAGGTLSSVYLSLDGRRCAEFVFGDRLHPQAPSAIRSLAAREYQLALVSGDGSDASTAVGRRLGIENAHGGMLPEDKAAFVEALRAGGRRVAMVGDGVNDAPALAAADLAVALHAGHDLGREAAHVVLMGGSLAALPDFLDLALEVNRKIRQNLNFSLFYNIVAIPVAMAGMLTPLVAVTAMLCSSLSVTGNTLLLIRSEHGRARRRREAEDRRNGD